MTAINPKKKPVAATTGQNTNSVGGNMSDTQITTKATESGLRIIPLSVGHIEASADRADELVALRPACEQLGIQYSKQLQKLKSKHWSTVALKYTVGADGKSREMVMVSRETFTMWLATLEPNRVNESARPVIIAFQKEAAAALDSYFHEGGAINPRASEDQLDRLSRIASARMNLIRMAEGIIQPDYLEAQARIVLAEGMGRQPELDASKLPLEVDGYLRERGVKTTHRLEVRGPFGNRLRSLYIAEFGEPPMKAPKDVAGSIRQVNTYTQEHRHLFDRVFLLMGLDQAELELDAA